MAGVHLTVIRQNQLKRDGCFLRQGLSIFIKITGSLRKMQYNIYGMLRPHRGAKIRSQRRSRRQYLNCSRHAIFIL